MVKANTTFTFGPFFKVKKFLVTILALLYLASVTGANLHLHYCMGELVSWKLSEEPLPNKCSKCGMTNEKGCCEDQHKFVKVDKDQKAVEAAIIVFKAPVAVMDNPYYSYTLTYSYNIIRQLPCSNAPPVHPKVPAYISHCVFRI